MELTKREYFALNLLQGLLSPIKSTDMIHNIKMAVNYADDLDWYLKINPSLEEEFKEPEEELEDIYKINRSIHDNPYALMFSKVLGGCKATFRIISTRFYNDSGNLTPIYTMEQVEDPNKKFEITDRLLDQYFE